MPPTSQNLLPSSDWHIHDLLLSLAGAVVLVAADFLLIGWLLH